MAYKSRGSIKCLFCERPAIGRKLCKRHYYQLRKKGRLHEFPVLGPEDVFDSRYARSDGCWNWKGTCNGYGYGIFLLPGEKPMRAHRYAYERINGPIPEGLVVMHSCDNPACVNPAHLSIGTRDDNNQDKHRKGRHPHGDTHHRTRLSDAKVAEIHAMLAAGFRQNRIAIEFGVDQSTISNIKTGKRRYLVGD